MVNCRTISQNGQSGVGSAKTAHRIDAFDYQPRISSELGVLVDQQRCSWVEDVGSEKVTDSPALGIAYLADRPRASTKYFPTGLFFYFLFHLGQYH